MTLAPEGVHLPGCNERCGAHGHWLKPSGALGEPFSHQQPPETAPAPAEPEPSPD